MEEPSGANWRADRNALPGLTHGTVTCGVRIPRIIRTLSSIDLIMNLCLHEKNQPKSSTEFSTLGSLSVFISQVFINYVVSQRQPCPSLSNISLCGHYFSKNRCLDNMYFIKHCRFKIFNVLSVWRS